MIRDPSTPPEEDDLPAPPRSLETPDLPPVPLAAAEVGPPPPAVLDGVDHALDPRFLELSRISAFISAGVLSLLALVGGSIAIFSSPVRWPWVLGLWLGFSLLLGVRAWLWPALSYRHTSYRLSARGLVIRRGVLWRSVAHVPRSRVQHTDVSQGPLERYFGLGTLTVHTAGTQFAAVSLHGLAHETAEQIRDVLIDGGEEDGV